MHELGLLCAVVKTVESVMQEEKLSRVDKIVLSVGELSGVVPHFLDECWPAAVEGTPLAKTQLEYEMVPGICRCRDCGREFSGYLHDLKCPDCGSGFLEPLTGTDFIIKDIYGD